MPLIVKLAYRNLLQDRLRFVATVIGIVFSIVLVTIQLGLFLGFERMVTTMVDHAHADLWIVPQGTKCFEDPSLLNERDGAAALKVPGVVTVAPVLIGFTEWMLPKGGMTPIFMVGSTENGEGLQPWDVIQGDAKSLTSPRSVAVDKTYYSRLGIDGLGANVAIRGVPAKVTALTDGIRSFTTTPYVFASLAQARTYTGARPGDVSYFLVHVAKGADIETVRHALAAKLPKVEVLTSAEFRTRSRDFWLFGTGAGAALFAGALLGAIVGTVIVAQTLYSSTKDHLNEFATLRAMGSSAFYVNKVIICQALISAVIGFSLAACIGFVSVRMTMELALPIVMTPTLTLGLFMLTVAMCVLSAVSAIVQVIRIEPMRVFKQ